MPVVELSLDSSKAVSELKKYDSAAEKSEQVTESSFSKIRTHANNIGTAIAAAFSVALVAVTAFSLKAVSMASSMLETQGVFDEAFQGMTATAEQWAIELSASYHLSELVAKQSLNTFQLVLSGMGVATAKAAQMSNALVRVGADLGAAFDRSTVEVVNDIRSALSGSMEVMDKYGVVIRGAQVEQKALAMGLAETKQEITQADKATATYALILEKTAIITGTTARESAGYAGQLKEARKNIDNLTTSLGTRLMPIFTQLLTAFNQWMTVGNGMNRIIDYSVEIVRFLVNGFFGLETVLKGSIVVIAKLAEGFIQLATPLKWILDAMVEIGAIDSNPIAELQMVMEQFTASAVENLGTTIDKIEDFNVSMDKAKTATESVNTATVKLSSEAAPAVEKLAGAVKNSAVPAELALENQINRVTDATNRSTQALYGQVAAASQVAMYGQTANETWSSGQTANETWSSGQTPNETWSGGDIGRAVDPNYESGDINVREFGGGKLGLDTSLGNLGGGGGGGGTVNLHINQSMSRSDVVNITEEQKRLASR